MRTTLTIDADVAAELGRLRRARNATLKDLVNDALRCGLRELADEGKKRKRFHTRSFHTGGLLVKSIDNIAELLAEIEGEAWR
jgi:hypothetical protein